MPITTCLKVGVKVKLALKISFQKLNWHLFVGAFDSNQYKEISNVDISDDESFGFVSTTKLPTTKISDDEFSADKIFASCALALALTQFSYR